MRIMRKKSVFVLSFLLVLLLFLSACGERDNSSSSGVKSVKPAEIKFAAVGNEKHPYTIIGELFKEIVEKKSGGQISVTVYPNGQLGGDREVIENVILGTIQMTAVSADGVIPAWVPELQVLSIPYLITSNEHAYKVLDGEIGQYLSGLMLKQGIRNLGFCELGFRHFTNNVREIHRAEDMSGLNLRVQESKVWFALTDALRATATPMSLTEVYTALQQGVTDGQENPPGTIRSMRFYEVQKYMCLDGHTYAAGAVVITPAFYDSLTEQQRQWIDEAAAEAIEKQRVEISNRAAEDVDYMAKQGMIITKPDKQSFMDATAGIADIMMNVVPMELVERVRALQ